MSELDRLALGTLLPAFAGTSLPGDYARLLDEGLAGVCYFGANTAGGPASVAALSAAIRAVSPHAVIAVDEEGGDVTRLHALDGSPVLGPAALGAVGDRELTRETGHLIGLELAATGISLDLGPVADVNSNPANPVIGTRSFGSDASYAALHVASWVEGLQEAGVAACAKHFPGHGDTDQDSHLALPTVAVDLGTLRGRELVPFAAAVEAGVAAVMTSHIVVPALDPDLPGTLSAPVLAVLREEFGFEGVIVTDALDMAGASAGRGIPEAAVRGLAAGADLLCIGSQVPAPLVREIQAAIVAAVREGRLSEDRLVRAAVRTARLRRPDVPPGADPSTWPDGAGERQAAGARRALHRQGPLPDLAGAEIVSVATGASIAVGDVPWGLPPDRWVEAGAPLAGDRPIVLQVRDAHRHAPQALDGAAVVIEWGWPGPYDGSATRICTHGYSRPAAAAVTELLREAGWDR